MERIYAISTENAELTQEEYAALSPQEHERLFSTFTAMLLSQFHNYVHEEGYDLLKDGVGFRSDPLYLSDTEFEEMMLELGEVVKSRRVNSLSPERRRRLFSYVVMPDVHAE